MVFPEVFLPDTKLEIVAVETDATAATVQVRLRSRAKSGMRLCCGEHSGSPHSGYEWQLKDLPCSIPHDAEMI
jgi:thiamine monophosphate kinase